MPLLNKKLDEFKVQSFYEGQFQEVTRDHLEGHWSVFVFYLLFYI